MLALVGLSLGVSCVAICFLHVDRIGVSVIASVLASIVWCSSVRQIHWDLNVVICQLWGCGGIIIWSLLLLLLLLWSLLVLLGLSSPGLWPELILVLSEHVVESSWIGDSLPSSDEFNHLSSLGDIDHLSLVFIVVLWEWVSDDFFQYAWG
jgi:hypothetical protein